MPDKITRIVINTALFTLGFFLFLISAVRAQTAAVAGVVTDTSGKSVPQSTVRLIRSGTLVSRITRSGEDGSFRFSDVASGTYSISVTSVGFRTERYGPFTLEKTNLFLPAKSIRLIPDTTLLKEIEVQNRRNPVLVRPGKTTINVDRSLYSGTALDLIARAPGVTVSPDGIVSLKGKQGILLLIDGKPAALNAENTTELLLGLQSTAIDQIELLTTPPAKYDAAGSAGVINIRLKKGAGSGTNGTITGGFGYGNFYKANGGFTLNHRTAKLNVYGSYNYGNNRRQVLIDLNRNIRQAGNLVTFDAENRNVQTRENHSIKAGLDYFITSKSTVGLSATGTYTDFDAQKNNRTLLQNNFRTDSSIRTTANQNRQLNGTNFAANYSLKLDTSGALFNAEAGYFIYNRHALELQDNRFLNANGDSYRNPAIYQIGSPSVINIYTASADLQKPFLNGTKLEMGMKYSRSVIDNQFDFASDNNGRLVREPFLSNIFSYREQVFAGYGTYHFSLAKSTSADAGLRAEFTRSNGVSQNTTETTNRSYLNLFPNVTISHEFNKDNQLTFTYNRRINRPLYSDLNPFVNFLDPYTYNQGNPLLRPEYAQNLELAYQFRSYLLTARYSYTSNLIYNLIRQNDVNRVLISSLLNLGNRYQYGLELNAPFEISKAYAVEANVEAGFIRFTGNALDNSSPNAIVKLTQNFDFGHGLTSELIGNYETPTVYGINRYRALYSADFAMGKSFLKKKLQVKLSVTDIFNSYRDRYYTSFQNLDLRSVEKAETRIARILLTYQFGRGNGKNNRTRPSNQDEQQRVGQ